MHLESELAKAREESRRLVRLQARVAAFATNSPVLSPNLVDSIAGRQHHGMAQGLAEPCGVRIPHPVFTPWANAGALGINGPPCYIISLQRDLMMEKG